MECVDISALVAGVLLALVKNVAMNEHQRTGLHLAHIVYLILVCSRLGPQVFGELRPFVVDEAGPLLAVLAGPHEPLLDRRAPVAPCCEAQASVLFRRVLKRIPIPYGAGRVCVQEGAVLMGRHCATNFWLLADDHGLKDTRVAETEIACDGCILCGEGHFAEGRRELVQVVANLVDGALLGLCQVA